MPVITNIRYTRPLAEFTKDEKGFSKEIQFCRSGFFANFQRDQSNCYGDNFPWCNSLNVYIQSLHTSLASASHRQQLYLTASRYWMQLHRLLASFWKVVMKQTKIYTRFQLRTDLNYIRSSFLDPLNYKRSPRWVHIINSALYERTNNCKAHDSFNYQERNLSLRLPTRFISLAEERTTGGTLRLAPS